MHQAANQTVWLCELNDDPVDILHDLDSNTFVREPVQLNTFF